MENRYCLIDAIRAVALINMVLYHFLYDVFVIFKGDNGWYRQTGIFIWEFCICSVFILISGMVWRLSSKPLKNGAILNLCGFAITLFTLFFIPDERIWFGILNFLGCAYIIMIPVNILAKKTKPYLGLCVSILLFMLTYRSIVKGYVGIFGIKLFALPDFLLNKIWLVPLGFLCSDFHSSDYFPIMPWFFMFLTGYFMGNIIMTEKNEKLLKFKVPFLSVLGRKSLLIYLLHQFVCYILALMISILFFSN